jgi:hypothetical protein
VNESRLIEELRAALDEEAGPVRAPAGAAGRARARARRRRLAHGLAAGVPAAGLTAGLAVGLVIALGGPRNPAVHPASPAGPAAQRTSDTPGAGPRQTPVLTVAYVTGRARAALDKASGSIVQTSGHGYVEWTDPASAAGRLEVLGRGGRLAADDGVTYAGNTRLLIYVDYKTRTWWKLTSRVPVLPVKPAPPGVLPVTGNSASGQVTILGHRKLDGQDTILVQYGPPKGFKPTASASWPTERVWLDAATYLPARIKIFGAGTQSEQNLAYLPVTPANLAKLTVTPPDGFKQVAPPPFRGDGRPGLGQIPIPG